MTTYNLHDLVWSRDVPEPARRAVAVLLDQNNSLLEQNTELDKKLAALEAINAQLLEALEGLERYSDGIICYASTMGEYEPNLLVFKARAALARAKGEA